ncbi:hypothetical protein [Nocardioides alkalitolerans]|uniref:hypothetical protein n=1 Tax=Nocardioides alkalitolerans TaxID=281714 RepID=UPI000416EE2E|nr:hypothetical protein [Nocardioides alkalitolerans]
MSEPTEKTPAEASDFAPEQQRRRAALTAARTALTASGGIFSSKIEGNPLEQVDALTALADWLLDGTPSAPVDGRVTYDDPDDDLAPEVWVGKTVAGDRWLVQVDTHEHTGMTKVVLNDCPVPLYDGDPEGLAGESAPQPREFVQSDQSLALRQVAHLIDKGLGIISVTAYGPPSVQIREGDVPAWVAELGLSAPSWGAYSDLHDAAHWPADDERAFAVLSVREKRVGA